MPLAMLLVALLPGFALAAADPETSVAAEGAQPAPTSQPKAAADSSASSITDDLAVDEGPPPGTCPVTEAIVDSYCKDHPDDAGCRAHRGE